jgi:Flp pilus assembly protein TadD
MTRKVTRSGRLVGLFGYFITLAILSSGCATDRDKPLTASAETLPPLQSIERGDRSVSEGNSDEALNYYVQALEKDPKNDMTLCKVALIHEDRGNVSLAESAYKMAADIAPRNAAALEGLGLLQFEQHKYTEAERNLANAVAADPKRWRSINGLGLIADHQKQFSRAASYYQKAIAIEANSPMLINNLGYSKYLSGDMQGAQVEFTKALNIDPKYGRAILNMGLVLARTGHEDEAFATFKNIMDESAAYNNLGYIHMLNKKYAEAEEYFQRSISLSPSYNDQANKNLVKLREIWRHDVDGK